MFKSILAFSAIVASACAQSIVISQPPDGTTVSPGESITVQITRPDTLTGSTEVSVALGLAPCPGGDCADFDVSERLGTILYSGPYQWVQYNYGSDQGWPYENFTVTIPADFPSGPADLSCSHFSLVGAGPYPNLEVKNITLHVQD